MASTADLSEMFARLVEKLGPGVVRIEARHRTPSTGIVWSSDGVVVTAHHTVEREEGIEVGFADGTTAEASLVGRDPGTDLAVLRLASGNLTRPDWSEAENLKVGHLVLAIARPGRSSRASLGIVSALGGDWRSPSGGRLDRYLQTDVQLQTGFSGSMLVDASGRVLGMNTTGLWRAHSLAVPTPTVRRTVEALLTHGRMRRGFVGIGAFPVRLAGKVERQAGQNAGLLVIAVQPEGPADKSGLILGDAILGVGGRTLAQVDDLLEALTEDTIGQELKFRVLRAGEIRELPVTVGTRS